MANPLEALLRPVAEILNRNISETTPARELVAALNGSIIAIRVRDTSLNIFFSIADDVVLLSTEYKDNPDVVISASLVTLGRMLASPDETMIRSGEVELTGDAVTAQRFQKLLGYAKPEVEEELSRVVGDVAAHRFAELGRSARNWASAARATMGDNVREYLQEESRDLPTRYEVNRFSSRLAVLRDDVERLAARLRNLEDGR